MQYVNFLDSIDRKVNRNVNERMRRLPQCVNIETPVDFDALE